MCLFADGMSTQEVFRTVQRDPQHLGRNPQLGRQETLQILDAESDGEGHGHHMTFWNQHYLYCKHTHTHDDLNAELCHLTFWDCLDVITVKAVAV